MGINYWLLVIYLQIISVYIIEFKINNPNIRKYKLIFNMDNLCIKLWIRVLKYKFQAPGVSISKLKYK